MVLGVDFNKVFKDVAIRQGVALERDLKDKGITVTSVSQINEGANAEDPGFKIAFDAAKTEELRELIKRDFPRLRLTEATLGSLELRLSPEFKRETREKTVNQSIEVIRNRIDEFGVAEPAIASQGNDRVVVELPGVREVQRAKDLIGRTAKLEFKIVNDEAMGPPQVAALISEIEKSGGFTFKEGDKFSDYVARLNQAAVGKIPAGTEIAFERERTIAGKENVAARIPYLLNSKVDVTGDDLVDAQVAFDQQTGSPHVAFSLNARGANAFGILTEANVRKRLAIVLDGVIHSAPSINSKITDRGQITVGGRGEQAMKEAKDLAIVLRAGALPAQLEFLEQRVVGPSLGQDSIAAGAKAGIIGILAIFIFISFYYRMSGMVASISLVMNAMFMLAILIGMEATLTLPGMAGIALTIGMAVDSNVIIFERIRDELHEGKSVSAAVSAGFQKAFTAIFDANITHGIIAAVLMSYGTGPIRGFAVSLFIGIFTTLFCAVTVCKLFFDAYIGMAKQERTSLSI
jgi:protein-export membrane protein SecD